MAQIKEMALHGIEFASRTIDHVSLRSVSLEQAKRQVVESKRQLEDLLQSSVVDFSYPYGHFTKAADRVVCEAGYRSCCTERAGVIRATTDPYRLVRLGILGTDTLADFAFNVRGAYDWYCFLAVQQ